VSRGADRLLLCGGGDGRHLALGLERGTEIADFLVVVRIDTERWHRGLGRLLDHFIEQELVGLRRLLGGGVVVDQVAPEAEAAGLRLRSAVADLVLVEEEAHALRERERGVERDVERRVAGHVRIDREERDARGAERADPDRHGLAAASLRVDQDRGPGGTDRQVLGRDDRRVERQAEPSDLGRGDLERRGARKEHMEAHRSRSLAT
jgi:hypothetical protein